VSTPVRRDVSVFTGRMTGVVRASPSSPGSKGRDRKEAKTCLSGCPARVSFSKIQTEDGHHKQNKLARSDEDTTRLLSRYLVAGFNSHQQFICAQRAQIKLVMDQGNDAATHPQ